MNSWALPPSRRKPGRNAPKKNLPCGPGIGKQFKLDVTQGLEYLIYEKQFPPYYAGEMLSTWELTPIELEVKKHGSKGYSNIQIGPQGHP